MKNKLFITIGYQAIISIIFVLSPYIVAIILAVENKWWFLPISIVASYFLYACIFNRCINSLRFKKGHVIVYRSFTPFQPMQHSINILTKDIVFLDFGFIQGNSKGKTIIRGWDIPCVTLTLSNENTERIVLCGYTKKQIKRIERAFITENDQMTIDHSADFLIKFLL